MVGDTINHLGIDNHRVIGDQIRNILTHLPCFEQNGVNGLLLHRYPYILKSQNQCIFVGFLMQSMTQFFDHNKGTAHYSEHQITVKHGLF